MDDHIILLIHNSHNMIRLGTVQGEEGKFMSVFIKQDVYWIDYYVNGQRKRERIGPDKKLAETVLRKRKVEIAEGKYLDK
jgi:hypothetical protein